MADKVRMADKLDPLDIVMAFLVLIPALILSLTGCGTGPGAGTREQETAAAGEREHAAEAEGGAYIEGRIEVVLNLDLLWEQGRGGNMPQGEEFDAGVAKIYDLATRHGCTVEKYGFYGPYEGATARMGLPAGKDENEAVAEFLEDPLVAHAYRVKASE